MWESILFISDYLQGGIDVLDRYSFDFGGFVITLPQIIFGLFAVSIVVTVFWKGARG